MLYVEDWAELLTSLVTSLHQKESLPKKRMSFPNAPVGNPRAGRTTYNPSQIHTVIYTCPKKGMSFPNAPVGNPRAGAVLTCGNLLWPVTWIPANSPWE